MSVDNLDRFLETGKKVLDNSKNVLDIIKEYCFVAYYDPVKKHDLKLIVVICSTKFGRLDIPLDEKFDVQIRNEQIRSPRGHN